MIPYLVTASARFLGVSDPSALAMAQAIVFGGLLITALWLCLWLLIGFPSLMVSAPHAQNASAAYAREMTSIQYLAEISDRLLKVQSAIERLESPPVRRTFES